MSDLLTVEDLADRYRTTARAIHIWRTRGACPPSSFKAGRRLMFTLDDVLEWEREQATAHQREE